MGLLRKTGADFGKEFKKHKQSTCKIVSNIDHVIGRNVICDLFCKKYGILYNSVLYRQDDLNEIKSKMNSLIKKIYSKHQCYSTHFINIYMVTSVAKMLEHESVG